MLTSHCTVSDLVKEARAHLQAFYPGTSSSALIESVGELVLLLFGGGHPDYQKADLKYHNLEHTLLATQCFIDLAEGRSRHGMKPAFNDRQFSLGCAAIMMHDAGYLKMRDDTQGTGAKYTASHVERSCVLASRFLPALGVQPGELDGVLNAIRCTGINSRIGTLFFCGEIERLTGCMVATADYLGQMADPRYPEKLPALFAEFAEANDFNRVPAEQRLFRSAQDLMAKTTGFWTHFVLPKLDKDYEGVYRLLGASDGNNPYLEAVEVNLGRIEEMALPGS
jgi:hypothetical protein